MLPASLKREVLAITWLTCCKADTLHGEHRTGGEWDDWRSNGLQGMAASTDWAAEMSPTLGLLFLQYCRVQIA